MWRPMDSKTRTYESQCIYCNTVYCAFCYKVIVSFTNETITDECVMKQWVCTGGHFGYKSMWPPHVFKCVMDVEGGHG